MEKRRQVRQPRMKLRDVAALAGCSTATVSRVLNSPETVGPEARKRVLKAVEELGYLPNSAARALRSRKSRIVGTVIPTFDHAIYARLCGALQQTLGASGYSLLVTTSNYERTTELEQTRILLGRGAEAVVLVGDSHAPDLYEVLELYDAPYVNTYVYNPESGHPCVGFDNRGAAAQAAEFLVGLGHRNIGMLAGITVHNDRASERVVGVRSTLARCGLSMPDEAIVERAYTIQGGREAVQILLSGEQPPTAIVCGSDVLAFGALFECEERGIRVPEDFSVVGFDDQEFAAHLKPPLTTIEVPAAQMGRQAAHYILHRLRDEPAIDFTRLEARLIVRRTTAQPRAAFRAFGVEALGRPGYRDPQVGT
jgi:LacI family transcriptional regulator